jgi:hypothetical protein
LEEVIDLSYDRLPDDGDDDVDDDDGDGDVFVS